MHGERAEEHGLTQRRTTLVSIAAATVLVAIKLGAGLASGSLGLISTGIESSGDVIAALLTFFAVRLSGRPADREHPYGHRRAENLGALGEAAILLAGAIFVAAEALGHLVRNNAPPKIHAYQFAVIGVAVAIDGSRTLVSARAASRYESPALRSNAYHFAGDMVASLAVLVGLVLVDGGAREGDSIAALAVAVLIAASAVRLISVNANVLMDRAPDDARARAQRAIAQLGGEVELSRLRVRESAGRYFADVVVTVPPGQALVESHAAASRVEAAVERALPGSDVVVHVEPARGAADLRQRILAIALAEPLVVEAHDVTVFEQPHATSVALHLKFPADLDLLAVARVAARVEGQILATLPVESVQTHLEPLEQTVPVQGASEQEDARVAERVAEIVRERLGVPPQRVRLFAVERGRVVFLTVALAPGESLERAHALAGELEELLRARIPDIVDVVVHTSP
ncbi:MAG TPA: cation diffusion facilitator family transporter [Solirubrobacteraceae bacterium]|nr:cation diffusion facilitator family transporter [Solirubrobacteraceae bacterium]